MNPLQLTFPALLSLLLTFGCSLPHDGTTSATPDIYAANMTLPPSSDHYEVIGEIEGIKNYVIKYDDRVYRGGMIKDDTAAEELHKLGIQTIISIIPNDEEREFCRKHNFTLVELPFTKTVGFTTNDLQKLEQTIKNAPAPFYMHCNGGNHRAGTLALAYRTRIQGWTYPRAVQEFDALGGDPIKDKIMLESTRTSIAPNKDDSENIRKNIPKA